MGDILKIISAGLILVGCGNSAISNLEGTWVGKRPITIQPGMSDGAVNTLSTIKLTFNKDATFTMIDSGMPKSGEVNEVQGKIELQVKTILNQPMEAQSPDVQKANVPIIVNPQPDGTIRIFDTMGFDSAAGIVLKRK